MRQVVGNRTVDIDAAAFADLRAAYDRLVLDLGTGDGKHTLTAARRDPGALIVGLDASPDAMRNAAARAAAKPARGGTPNALFVWAPVEQLPPELTGVTDVHVLMPWGSLLRTLVEPDADVLRRIAGACVPGARFLVTLNLHAWRPPVPEVGTTPEPTPDIDFDHAGWVLEDAAYADPEQLADLGTSWTKRLGSSRDQLAVLTLHGRIDGAAA